jgi:hypothetical protein
VAVTAFWQVHREARPDGVAVGQVGGFLDRFAVLGAAVYLLVFIGLWAGALPAYLHARAGHTAAGAPTGSLGYALACLVVCLGLLAVLSAAGATRPAALVPGRSADANTRW